MVIEAFSSSKSLLTSAKKPELSLAAPLDRLAAAVLDWLVIVTPVLVAIMAPFKRTMTESVLLDLRSQLSMAIGFCVLISVVVIWAYQTFFIYYWGATPGKMAFGLRVVDFWDQARPSLGASSWRAMLVVIEVALLGLPWLAALSDKRRRVLHDKVADTMVIALKRASAPTPSIGHVAFVRGIYAATMGLALAILAATTNELYQGLETEEKFVGFARSQEDHAGRCPEVEQVMDNRPASLEGDDRLQAAMELFAAGLVDQECLAVEADRSLNHSTEPTALGYLAMAFAQADDPDASNEYLDQTCQTDSKSEACHMTNVVMNWSSQDWHKVADTFSSFGDEASSHVQIWKLRYLMRQGHYVSALRLIGLLDGHNQVAEYLIPERVKALWRANRQSDAQLVANTALDTLPKGGRKNLSSWMCYEQLSSHCEVTPPRSCLELMKSTRGDDESDLTPTGWLAMTLVKEKCDGAADSNAYGELMEATNSNDVREFLTGLNLWAQGKTKEAKEKLGEMVMNEDYPDSLRAESLSRMIKWSTQSAELQPWVAQWKEMNSSSKHNLGTALFRALVTRGELVQAVEVGQDVLKDSPEEMLLSREVAVAAYRAGDRKAAWQLVQRIIQSGDVGRKPSSIDEFSRMVSDLTRSSGK